MHQPQGRVEHLRIARIRHQAGRIERHFEKIDTAAGVSASTASVNAVGGAGHDGLAVRLVDAAAEVARAPDAHQIGRGMIVRRGHDHVVEARRRRQAAPNGQHLVVEEPDGIERDQPDAMLAVVDDGGDGLQIVVDLAWRRGCVRSPPPTPDGAMSGSIVRRPKPTRSAAGTEGVDGIMT